MFSQYFYQMSNRKGGTGEEPPYLTVGTDVSAKYRGAFCEAKVKKVTRIVKCKVTFKGELERHACACV